MGWLRILLIKDVTEWGLEAQFMGDRRFPITQELQLMNFSHAVRRVLAVVIAIGFLQGCDNDSNPAPDETAKPQPVSPVLMKLRNSPKKQDRGVPKSTKVQ
jgi:hypothetical protein